MQDATIVLAEDHVGVRQLLSHLLAQEPGFHLVADTGDGLEAARLTIKHSPDVLVTDLSMPGLPGLELTRRVRQQAPRTRIVIVSIHADEAYVAQALRLGAVGYVAKDDVGRHLVPAIHAALAGKQYLSPLVASMASRPAALLSRLVEPAPADSLSSRDRSALLLVAQGYTDPEIALFLKLPAGRAARLRTRLMRRLGASTNADLTALARKKGLVGRTS